MSSQAQLQQHLHWLTLNWKCFNLHDIFVVCKHCKLISKISWINKFESETPSSQLLCGYNSNMKELGKCLTTTANKNANAFLTTTINWETATYLKRHSIISSGNHLVKMFCLPIIVFKSLSYRKISPSRFGYIIGWRAAVESNINLWPISNTQCS